MQADPDGGSAQLRRPFRVKQVAVHALPAQRFEDVLDAAQYAELRDNLAQATELLRGRVVWNVNSTSRGGGVAELLRPLLGYARGAGVDARWMVIRADADFFLVTKRLHNRLHGHGGDDGALGAREHAVYEAGLGRNARRLSGVVGPDDVVVLHDPQTAGLVEPMKAVGARVIWRSHVGRDRPNATARQAWEFLRGYVAAADAFVFSRPDFVWSGLPRHKVEIIQPSIDVFSPKNQPLSSDRVRAILHAAAITDAQPGDATFTRSDGSPGRVDRSAEMIQDEPLPHLARVVAQVSRWDGLKDPLGVLHGFARHVARACDARLLLAGPAVGSVADDPEELEALKRVEHARRALPAAIRSRVHLALLPMYDSDENAVIVNAVQRHADVVVQKSLAEGFGLTIVEAMWKCRPVVASRVGGIQDQVVDGRSGILLRHPRDLAAFGDAVRGLLGDPEGARRMGEHAHDRVRHRFLGPRHLGDYLALLRRLIEGEKLR